MPGSLRGVQRAEANREFWQRQYERMSKLTAGAVTHVQTKDEALNQLQSAAAGGELEP